MTRAKCAVDDCDVEGDLDSVRPHVVHTSSDEDHRGLGVDDVVILDEPGGDPESSSSASESSSESKNDDAEAGPGDATPGVEAGKPGESTTENDENGENDTQSMDDLERQREKLSSGGGGESKDGDDQDGATEGVDDDPSEDPLDDPSIGVGNLMPSFDTRTLLILGAVTAVVIIGYLYLRDDDTESSSPVVDDAEFEEDDDPDESDPTAAMEGGLTS